MRKLNTKLDIENRRRIGGKWKILIMIFLYDKPERFNKIRQLLCISPNVLTTNLKQLERDGLVIRKINTHVKYHLSPPGRRIAYHSIEIRKILETI